MTAAIAEKLCASFEQAACRGIPASEIISPLAKKFNLRRNRVIESLVAAKRIQTTEFCGTTIVWHAAADLPAKENANMRRQISADLLQAGVNLGLASGDLERTALQSSSPEEVLRKLIPQVLNSTKPIHRAADDVVPENAPGIS